MDIHSFYENIKSQAEAINVNLNNEMCEQFYYYMKLMLEWNENINLTAIVEEDDSVLFFNFRPDRARQITRAFVDDDFQGFQRNKRVHTYYLTMTEYDKNIKNVEIAYRNSPPVNSLGEYISKIYSETKARPRFIIEKNLSND